MTVLELLEKGELQKLHKKWWFDKGECVVDDSKVLLRVLQPVIPTRCVVLLVQDIYRVQPNAMRSF